MEREVFKRALDDATERLSAVLGEHINVNSHAVELISDGVFMVGVGVFDLFQQAQPAVADEPVDEVSVYDMVDVLLNGNPVLDDYKDTETLEYFRALKQHQAPDSYKRAVSFYEEDVITMYNTYMTQVKEETQQDTPKAEDFATTLSTLVCNAFKEW